MGKASRQSRSCLPLKNGNFRLRQARVPVQNFNFFLQPTFEKKAGVLFLVLSHYRRNGKKSSESLDKFRTRKVRQSVRIFFLAFLHTYGKVCSNEKEKRQAKKENSCKKERKEKMESKKVLLEKVKRLDLEGLWKEAELKFEGKTYVATFKQFDEGSKFGIDGGRISKLTLIRKEKNEKVKLANFDRGWDLEPTEEAKAVLEVLLDNEN